MAHIAHEIIPLQPFLDELDISPSKTCLKDVVCQSRGELIRDPGSNWRLMGKVSCLTIMCLDFSYVTSVVSHFMHSPGMGYLSAMRHLLRYQKGSPSRRILYSYHVHLNVEAFTDAD